MANYVASAARLSGPGHGFGGNVKVAWGEASITAALTTADTFEFCKVPAGATVLYVLLEADDLDTNGAPTLTINVGDAGSATRFFSASTVGQAGTASAAPAVTGLFYTYSAETKITGTVQANAATGATSGAVRLAVVYALP